MSLASLRVLMCRMSGPPLRAQASAILRDQATLSAMSPFASG
jgi:hypothetical protein